MMKMQTDGEEGMRNVQLDGEGESSILRSKFYLDNVGEVVLSVNSTGLSWRPVDCLFDMYRFIIHAIQRSKTQPSLWMLAVYTFGHQDAQICELFANQINSYLSKEPGRPKSLLVFINPLSGKRDGRGIWDIVAPIFSHAKVKTKGGDGFFNEILNGLLSSRFKAPYPPVPPDFIDSPGADQSNLDPNQNETAAGASCEGEDQSPLLPTSGHNDSGVPNIRIEKSDSSTGGQDEEFCVPNEWFRFGIIPAGSTDATVICTTGVRDPITSALHIVLGKRVSLDIAQVVRWKATSSSENEPSARYTASFVGYGFYGDVIVESEKYRWMGPKRYDFAGTKVFLRHSSYEAEVAYLEVNSESKIPDAETDHQNGQLEEHHTKNENCEPVICRANCKICCTSSLHTDEEGQPSFLHSASKRARWSNSRGHFLSVGAAVISCRNERAPDGLVADAHLSDGFLHLVLIKECHHTLYLWHLLQLARKGGKPLSFRFVEHHKTPAFAFTSFGKQSLWNLDGELLQAHKLSAQVFRGLVSLFATGPEV
ncbi:hypothetical protein Ancab_010313 [Ancistrocladus abbreviatus]